MASYSVQTSGGAMSRLQVGGSFGAAKAARLSGSGQSSAPTTTYEPAPDDRYLPGYTTLYPDGSSKYVGPRLKDLNEPYAFFGTPIPITIGTRRLTGTTIWARPYEERTVKKKKKSGKGGGPKKKSTTYEYYNDFAVSFGYVQDSIGERDILRVWADGQLVWDRRTTQNGAYPGLRYRFYPGSETQTPDPLIEEDFGVGSTPAFRGLMYVVIEDIPLSDFGNRRPTISIEVGDDTIKQTERVDFGTEASLTTAKGVDWDRRVAWTINSDRVSINEYDLESGLNTHRIVLTGLTLGDAPGAPGTNLAIYTCLPIPWLGLLVTTSGSIGQQALHLIEPISGSFLTWFGSDELSLSGTVGKDAVYEVRFSAVNRLYGMLGLAETYVCVCNIRNDWVVLRVLAPGEAGNIAWMLMPVASLAKGGSNNMNGCCPGKSVVGSCDFFTALNNVITKITIPAGVVWDAAVDPAPSTNVTVVDPWLVLPNNIAGMKYYEPENVLIVQSNQKFYKIDADSNQILAETDAIAVGNTEEWWMSDASLGRIPVRLLGTGGNNWFGELDVASMEIVISVNTATYGGVVGPPLGDPRTRSVLVFQGTTGFGRTFYDKLGDRPVTLAQFLNLVASMSGLQVPAEFEVAPEVDDVIVGAMIVERTTLKQVLLSLSAVYRFDYPESGGKIRVIRKAQNFAAFEFDIPQDDLAVVDTGGVSYRAQRNAELSLPRRVELSYLSQAINYNYTMMPAQRSAFPVPTSAANDILVVRIPVIIADATAKALAYRMLYQGAWASRASYAFRLPWKYLDKIPSDVGQVTAGGRIYTVKITEISFNADLSMDVKAEGYLSDVPITIDADPGMSYTQSIPGPVVPLAIPIDSVLLRTQDETANMGMATMYWVLGPYGSAPTWRGATVEISHDNIAWTEADENVDVPLMGSLIDDIPATDNPHETQFEMEFRVRLMGMTQTLDTISYDELNEGANAALVGRPETGWEVIQFIEATDNGNKEWLIRGVRRGRRGSDVFSPIAGKAGDWFIMLDDDWVHPAPLPLDVRDQGVFYRSIGFGQTADLGLRSAFQFGAESAVPLPPVHLRAKEWNAGNLRVDFIRQTRAEAEWGDGTLGEQPPLLELTEEYVLWVYPDDSFASAGAMITAFVASDDRTRMTIPGATLNAIYGTSTPSIVYVGAAQYSAYLSEYGHEARATLRTP